VIGLANWPLLTPADAWLEIKSTQATAATQTLQILITAFLLVFHRNPKLSDQHLLTLLLHYRRDGG